MFRTILRLTAMTTAGLLAGPALATDMHPLHAVVNNTDGTEIGQVTAQPTASGQMHLTIVLHDMPPGTHAVHVHETGACTPDFKAAGGHLSGEKDHGVMAGNGPHPGDLPNVHIPDSGLLSIEYFVPGLTPDMMMDADGAAFVIHNGADDYTSQPAGDAGDRIACGVFEAAK